MGIVPLPRRVPPQPWEDLASLVRRTATAMGYPDPRWVVQPAMPGHAIAPDELPVLNRREDYLMLTQLLALSREQLLSLTLYRFTPQLSSLTEEERQEQHPAFDQHFVSNHPLLFPHPAGTTRVCPLCLDEGKGPDDRRLESSLLSLLATASAYFEARQNATVKDIPFGRSLLAEEPLFTQMLRPHLLKAHVFPFLWEDITSLITRMSEERGYKHPRWMLVTAEQPHRLVSARDLPLLHQPHDYRILQQHSGLGEDELYGLTLHRFAQILQHPDSVAGAAISYAPHETIDRALLTPYNARRHCPSLFQTKICPLCLDEAVGYDRLYWRLDAIVLCPQHLLPLLDRCPHCQAAIPTLRGALTRCPSCFKDYRHAPRAKTSTPVGVRSAQSLILRYLGIETTSIRAPSPDFPLFLLRPWQFFRLFQSFHELLLLQPAEGLLVRTLGQLACSQELMETSSFRLLTTAMHLCLFQYLFTCWPTHFLSFLDHLAPFLKGMGEKGSLVDPPQNIDELISWFHLDRPHDDPYLFVQHLLSRCHSLGIWGPARHLTGQTAFPPVYLSAVRASSLEYSWRLGRGPFIWLP